MINDILINDEIQIEKTLIIIPNLYSNIINNISHFYICLFKIDDLVFLILFNS